MMKKYFILLLPFLALTTFLCSNSSESRKNHLTENISFDTLTGKDLFRLNCAGCHGLNKEGHLPIYPSFVNISSKLSKQKVEQQINNGSPKGMPAFTHLSAEQKNAIIAYMFNEPSQNVIAGNFSSIDKGKMLFTSNCSGCHRASVNDPEPLNAKAMCPMMEPATLAGATKRFTKEEFYTILNTGPCYMPSFDFMTNDEKDALLAYLKTLEGKGEPEIPTMGQMCPMMKMGMGNMNDKEMNIMSSVDSSKYTCPMHPGIFSDKPGKCPKCGMDLVKKSENKNMNMEKDKMKRNCPMMKKGKSCCGM